jgi:tryptophan-rich sensory protein
MNLSVNPVSSATTVSWYQTLKKPFFAPPSWVFGVAWGILYPIIFVSFGYVFYQIIKKKIPSKIAIPFALNLIFNFAFSPIQFGLQNNLLAAVDITLTVATLIWAMKTIYPFSRPVALAQIPYLCWGLFATVLQYSVTILNW